MTIFSPRRAASITLGACLLVVLVVSARCLVDSVCFDDADCPAGHFCDRPTGLCEARCQDDDDCLSGSCDPVSGQCEPRDCADDDDCALGLQCEDGRCLFCDPARCNPAQCEDREDCADGFDCIGQTCVSIAPLSCPEGMVAIEDRFCIDIYEASRPDADEHSEGSSTAMAMSQPGVLPWNVASNAAAEAACWAAGKTLCTESMWFEVCRGPQQTVYSYGDDYSADICNGIDKYCPCDAGSCAGHDPCPFPHCYTVCGASFRPDPTGANPACTNSYGVFDINGNVWEHVRRGDETRIRGGAFNCSNSERLHRCDYIPGDWAPSARGFRCCSLGVPAAGETPDGGAAW